LIERLAAMVWKYQASFAVSYVVTAVMIVHTAGEPSQLSHPGKLRLAIWCGTLLGEYDAVLRT